MDKKARKWSDNAWTDEDQLRWALDFTQADLAKWRDGDWLNALEDLADLLFGGGKVPEPGPALYHALEDKSVKKAKAWLTALQRPLRTFIERLYAGEPASVSFTGSRHFLPHPEGLARGKGLQYVDVPKAQDFMEGLVSEVLLRVGDLLTRIDLSRLKKCSECQRLFLAVRRQRFDTPQCSLRDRLRRFREKKRTKRVPRRSPRSMKRGRTTR